MDKGYVYEKINHKNRIPFKIFVASLEGSCPHWHEDYEMVLLLKNSISVRFAGEAFKLNTGDILLINSKEIHSIFDCEEGNIALFIQFHQLSKFYQLLGDLFLYATYDIHYSDSNSNKENDNVSLDKLTGYIEKSYSRDLDTGDICRYLGMSRSTLYRYMQSTLGMSLNEFIRYHRIEQAKKLLESTDYSISHIATLCGYLNDMSFYRAFRKETNKTPQDFREKGAQTGTNLRIQGYLSYNNNEAYQLACKYASKE